VIDVQNTCGMHWSGVGMHSSDKVKPLRGFRRSIGPQNERIAPKIYGKAGIHRHHTDAQRLSQLLVLGSSVERSAFGIGWISNVVYGNTSEGGSLNVNLSPLMAELSVH